MPHWPLGTSYTNQSLRRGYGPNLKHLMSLPALHRPGRSNSGLLLPSTRPPHSPLPPPLFLQNRKPTQVSPDETERVQQEHEGVDLANPGIRLGIFLQVIRVEAVTLQETPALPRRLRRRRALRSRGGGHRETASGEPEGEALMIWTGERREEGGGSESGGSHWRRAVENPKLLSGGGREGIRGGFSLSVCSDILNRLIEFGRFG